MTTITSENFAGIYLYYDQRSKGIKNRLPDIDPVFRILFEEANICGPYVSKSKNPQQCWDFMPKGIYRKIAKKHFQLFTSGIMQEFQLWIAENNKVGKKAGKKRKIELGPGIFYGCVQGRFRGDGEYNLRSVPIKIKIGTEKDRKVFFRKSGYFIKMKWEEYQKFEDSVFALTQSRDHSIKKAKEDYRLGIEKDDESLFESLEANRKSSLDKAYSDYFAGMEELITSVPGADTLRPCGGPCQRIHCPYKLKFADYGYNLGRDICQLKYYANMDVAEKVGCADCPFKDEKICDVCNEYKKLEKAKEIARGIIAATRSKR